MLVVLHEESFFGNARAFAPRQFWRRAIIAWLIIVILPGTISVALGFVTSIARVVTQSVDALTIWYLVCGLLIAMLQSFLASRLLWGPAVYSKQTAPEFVIDRPAGLFLTYALLFTTVTLLSFGFWYFAGMDFMPLAILRMKVAAEAVMALLAVLATFVAVQRASAIDKPSITSVFE